MATLMLYLEVSKTQDQYLKENDYPHQKKQMNFSEFSIQLSMSEKYWYVVGM